MLEKNNRVSYFRDPRNLDRVMTLVTKVDGEHVFYGFAINRPAEWRRGHDGRLYKTFTKRAGDRFTKQMGLRIAQSRLAAAIRDAESGHGEALMGLPADIVALTAIVKNSKNTIAKRIATSALSHAFLRDTLQSYLRQAGDHG